MLEFIKESQQELDSRKLNLDKDRSDIVEYFEDKIFKNIGVSNITIQGRVKGSTSLREKIIRKNYFNKFKDAKTFIDELPDLIGIRLICLLEKEEDNLFKKIKGLFSEKLDEEYNIIPDSNENFPYLRLNLKNQPGIQKNGHNIYKMNAQWVKSNDDVINVELQIKSLINTFWGEIEHMLFYKNYANMIGNNFYKSFMDSTYELLHTVDFQLQIIKDQLQLKESDMQQVLEIKEIATRILYNTYQQDVLEIFDCNINLKEAFEFIVDIYFIDVDTQSDALQKLDSFISSINSRKSKLDHSQYEFDKYEEKMSSVKPELQQWSKEISDLVESRDIFWNTFFAVYRIINSEKKFTKIVDEVSVAIDNFFGKYTEEFDMGTDGIIKEVIIAINCGILEAFKIYKKIDFFSENVHRKNIISEISEFICAYQNDIYNLESNITQEQKICMFKNITQIIKIRILCRIGVEVETEDLERVLNVLNDKDGLLLDFGIDIDKLSGYVKEKKVILNYDNLKDIYKKEGEEND